MCGTPATTVAAGSFIPPGVMHDVLLDGLKPNTHYFYRFGTQRANFSEERSFKTPPAPGTPGVRFIAYGDLGVTTPGPQGTVDLVYKEIEQTDFILHFGDVSYARGHAYL